MNKQKTLEDLFIKNKYKNYAIGAFNCRYYSMIGAVLKTAEKLNSPVCLQISEREIDKYKIDVYKFIEIIKNVVSEENITIPYSVNLDHGKSKKVVLETINAGFKSVMIDASNLPLNENISVTREIVNIAHEKGITVEAELGKIFSNDSSEVISDKELYTDPDEATIFVEKTNIDSLAVSVGTAHGVYKVKNPKIDFERIREICNLIDIPLVLHGGSGLPDKTLRESILSGIKKINVATDLEIAFLKDGIFEVENVVEDRIKVYNLL